MVCRNLGGVIACGPPGIYCRRVLYCPECNRRHRFVISWDGAWYGTTSYGACGDRWQDGECAPRPFEQSWRKKAQAHFREMWKYAAPRDLYDAYRRADCDAAVARGERRWRKAIRKRQVIAEMIRRGRAA